MMLEQEYADVLGVSAVSPSWCNFRGYRAKNGIRSVFGFYRPPVQTLNRNPSSLNGA